jgi:hypothetical protein
MTSSLLEVLRAIPDRRRAAGKRFDLASVLLYSILGMVAVKAAQGANTPTTWRCGAAREMRVGPSESAIRRRLQNQCELRASERRRVS